MAEVPLQFSNRIAGKKSGSLWWTIGINNQFRMKFTQQSVTDSHFRGFHGRLQGNDVKCRILPAAIQVRINV